MSDRAIDTVLLLAADILGDLEGTRIAMDNRLLALRTQPDEDGQGFGKGVDLDPKVEARLLALRGLVAQAEHAASLELQRAMRSHPLGPFVERTIGLGLRQTARLIAAIGNPGDREKVSSLHAYCGYHVVNGRAPRREKGQQCNWNTDARARARMVAESCVKQLRSPYRAVYDDARAKYAEATHEKHECAQCGPKGKPAQLGSPLSDGHKHARGLRAVAKAVLEDLWRESRATAVSPPNERAPAPVRELVPA